MKSILRSISVLGGVAGLWFYSSLPAGLPASPGFYRLPAEAPGSSPAVGPAISPDEQLQQQAETELDRWKVVRNAYFQKESDIPSMGPEEADEFYGHHEGCALPGMVHVSGKRLGDLSDDLQWEACPVDQRAKSSVISICKEYDAAKWAEIRQKRIKSSKGMDFCIDRFEFPNVRGQNPWIRVNVDQAEALCKEQGKRLCSEEEWIFSCEGEEGLPYPYGYKRDPEACNIDKAPRPFNERVLSGAPNEAMKQELAKLWQGVPSGTMEKCVSPFGVYDLTGNIDEWTIRSKTNPNGAQKGGYWGPVRTRCRPATYVHGARKAGYVFYQQGFRCCSDR